MRSSVLVLNVFLFLSLPAVAQTPQPESKAQAYVPMLLPLTRVEPPYPDAAREQKLDNSVQVLLTLDPNGKVTGVEPLAGSELLRPAAIDAVKQWTFRPVIRDGKPVVSYTSVFVYFTSTTRLPAAAPPSDSTEMMRAYQRLDGIAKQFPRSTTQVLSDLEQDSQGGDERRRASALDRLAKAAVNAGAMDKAEAYATELLASELYWSRGNAVHTGNTVLGRVALSRGDVAKARDLLLAAGETDGSPQLNSFGPNMTLAKELLERGEKDTVLAYFELCRKFWKRGEPKLNDWSDAVRAGHTPNFGANLAY